MAQSKLFAQEDEPKAPPTTPPRRGPPRLSLPDRAQVRMRTGCLDELVPANHRVRAIWAFVCRLDLEVLLAPIKVELDGPGHPAIDPRILLTLWLYATSKGIGSAREIDRLCEEHDVYRWICGGVSVNHHTIADFRSHGGEAMSDLLTQLLASLMRSGVVRSKRLVVDGLRVRANAGADSFHREPTLKACLAAAKARVKKAEKNASDPHWSRRKKAAQERAAREQLERAQKALAELPAARASKKPKEKDNARVSTTDPEARVMHMPDNGFRPAFNVQLATDTESRLVVGVRVTNVGTDAGQLRPMLDEVEGRLGQRPKEVLVDGGFVNLDAIQECAEEKTVVYAPVPMPKKEGVERFEPKEDDPSGVAAWRRRMDTPRAKEVYKERAATAETANADLTTKQGLRSMPVRGLDKALAVALLSALTYNVVHAIGMGALA